VQADTRRSYKLAIVGAAGAEGGVIHPGLRILAVFGGAGVASRGW
jgi:hypothetical protein